MSTSGGTVAPAVLTVANLARNGDLLRRAANLLRRGGLVAFPTEGGYVMGGRADDSEALKRLARLRRLPEGVPWTLYCKDLVEARTFLGEPSELLSRVGGVFWPGPLTILARPTERVPGQVTAGLAKVAVRVPGHRLAQALLSLCRCPVVARTARLPGGPAIRKGAEVLDSFGGGLDALLEGRDPAGCLEPAVLDLAAASPRLIRMGTPGSEEIRQVLGRTPLLSSDQPTPAHFTRFSPEARLVVVEGELERVARRMRFLAQTSRGRDSVALLVTPLLGRGALAGQPGLHILPDPVRAEELAGCLFELLRRFEDEQSVRLILVEGLPREGPTAGLMERLTRLAHQVINTEDPGYAGQAGQQPRQRGQKN